MKMLSREPGSAGLKMNPTSPPVKKIILLVGVVAIALLTLLFRILVSHHFERAYERFKKPVQIAEPTIPYTDQEEK